MRREIALPVLITLLIPAFFLCCQRAGKSAAPSAAYSSWQSYGGGPDDLHYSTLKQINRHNVSRLRVAWKFDTGDAFPSSLMESNPIIIHNTLYATTPKLNVIALDASTGKLLWRFAPNEGQGVYSKGANRGVTYWSDGSDQRIFSVAGPYLYALNAKSGKLIPSFGDSGRVDLRKGLGRGSQNLYVTASSPGVIYRNLLIMGSEVAEDLPAAPGDIRAFDVRTGKIRWTFHTIPHPGELGYNTWPKDAWKYSGGANDWGGMAIDRKRGLVFAPTGSAAFDFYGADRLGNDLFANCLIALNAATGKLVWYFQGVRHDLWDRDFPTAPTLIRIKHNGHSVNAVAQITKSGYVFVFDEETGKPIFPIEYRKVPASDVDGERAAKTQPFPLLPPPFAAQDFTAETVTNRTPEAHKAVLERLKKLRHGGQFIPPSFQGTVYFPGTMGGGEWGGPAFDPATGVLYVNSNQLAKIFRLVPRPRARGRVSGRTLYLSNCSSCHKADLSGSPPEFPSLKNIGNKYNTEQVAEIASQGRGRMPSFAQLGSPAVRAIALYLTTGKQAMARAHWNKAEWGPWLKYRIDGYNKFLDPEGYPANKPPWGT
ncbi:MAG: PQQ-binding-like beta-propeller repeat protein, partial [Terriglobia bacterium]